MSYSRGIVVFLIVLLLSVVCLVSVFGLPESPGTFSILGQDRRAQGTQGFTDGNVFAGNVTHLSVVGFSITQSWAGFYGNISGTIVLDDSFNRTLYNWTLADPRGEIYATTSVTINWSGNITAGQAQAATGYSNLRCWNTFEPSAGLTNLSELEDLFDIGASDVDGIDETFRTGIHAAFVTAAVNFSANSCRATSLFLNTELQDTALYQEVILLDQTNDAVIWTALLSNGSTSGFTGGQTDFEMMVPENGNGTNTAPTTYYFYVELE